MAYVPVAMEDARAVLPDIKYCEDAYETVEGADALIIVTEWNQFRNLDLKRIKTLLRKPSFFDLRNIYEPEKMRKLGFDYYCVGR